MVIKSKYLLQTHKLVETEDLSQLPTELRQDYEDIYKPILKADPYNCGGLTTNQKKGKLTGYWALEIDWRGISYRLIYSIYESPSPRRVFVVSFGEHDPAYDNAKERIGK